MSFVISTRRASLFSVCSVLALAACSSGSTGGSNGAGGSPSSGAPSGGSSSGGASSTATTGGTTPASGGAPADGGGPSGDSGSGTVVAATGGDSSLGGSSSVGGSGGGSTGGASAGSGGSVVGVAGGGTAGPLAAKPLMGWSTWSSTTGNITEAKVKAAADNVAANLAQYGYQYINIDDGWYSGFDMYGRWQPDTRKFPDGFKGAADYVHSKGLKIGIYLTPGVNDTVVNANSPIEGTTYHVKDIVTSGAGSTDKASGATSKKIDFTKPGAVEYVQGYANLFASWGVDFIKMDFVGPGGGGGNADNRDDVKQWRMALDKSGRQIWLELSNMLNISGIATWTAYSNGWRVANDVECYCSTLTNWTHVVRVINAVPPFAQYSGPGHWNDLDSLELGAGTKDGLSADEKQAMFSFWAINAAPLYLGADATVALDATDLKIITNKEVIAVDQAGVPGKALSTGDTQVWYSKQTDGSIAVGLFNWGSGTANASVSFSAVGGASSMNVRDLVSQTDLGKSSGSFSASLPSHGSRMIKLTP